MLERFILYCKLARLQAYTGYILVFFPASFGLVLASESSIDLKLLLLFFLSSIICRGAGCVINDIFDRNLDKHVERTKTRPLANNSLQLREAIIVLAILSFFSLFILLTLNRFAIILGVIASVMIVIYPLMKRITYFPQLFLGLVFNFGVLIAYVSVSNSLSLSAIFMYSACGFWTIGYDSIYAFMDLTDDKNNKIKSIAIFLEHKNYKLFLAFCYFLFIILFINANILSDREVNNFCVAIGVAILSWQIFTLDIANVSNCLIRFKSNNYVGAVLLLSIL